MASKSGNTQTLIIFVCKTGLTGSAVLARFISASVLKRKENMKYPKKIVNLLIGFMIKVK